jgi:polyferredoxin
MRPNDYRRISQIFFFILFLILLNRTEYSGNNELSYPVRIFLDIDPLIALTTFLTTYTVPLLLWLSLFTVILTLIFGRFFCGWICPFGSINHFASYTFDRIKPDPKRGKHSKSQKIKYVILLVLLGSSLAGLHLVGILDPISLAIRSFTVGILPVVNYVLRSIIYPVLSLDLEIVDSVLLPAFRNVKSFILSHEQTFYWQGFFIFSIFTAILLLNLIKNRFFCRVLCPLGALYGFISKYSVLELDQSHVCDSCNKCVRTSQGGASPHEKGKWKKTENIKNPCQ